MVFKVVLSFLIHRFHLNIFRFDWPVLGVFKLELLQRTFHFLSDHKHENCSTDFDSSPHEVQMELKNTN